MAKKPTKKEQKIKADIEAEAIKIVLAERDAWEDAVCYVTEKVGFKMRELIRTLRKNYWGVFDEPIDPITGREKVFIPLPMTIVEDVTKNIDIDQKDVTFSARTAKGYALTDLTRGAVKETLSNMYFGEILDQDQRQCVIDGTVVWKTWEDNTKGKPKIERRTVDLLHCYIDPTADSIQSAYRFTERGLLLPDQVRAMDWLNTDDVEGMAGLDSNDSRRGARAFSKGTAKYVDVWEMWGKIPKWLLTGDKKADDADDEIDGHIIVSGLDAQNPRLQLIEENKRKDKFGNVIKPYEEWRPCKIAGRWYGLGYVERILALTEWLNTTDNIRINRNYVSQLGLFKIKKGKGITPQMLSKLPVNGAIAVNDMDDIQQFNVQEMGATSYKDEEVIKEWAVKVTSAHPISAGDAMPASTSATAASIASTSAKSSYTLFKEATGFFLERWIDRHALPIIAKMIKYEDVVRLSTDDAEVKALIERVISKDIDDQMAKLYEQGMIPSEQQLLSAIQRAEDSMKKQPQMFIKVLTKLMADAVDTKVRITNEDMDTQTTVQNLMSMANIQITPQNEPIIKQMYDLLGLDQPRIPQGTQPIQQPATQPVPQMQ